MQIGANGCKWVWMDAIGCRGAGGQANKASIHIYCYVGHAFWPYGRGNFPGHHVLRCQAKSGVDGC